jgi:hypothetical protein
VINDGVNDVPKNTIAVFCPSEFPFNSAVPKILDRPSKGRDWFTPQFYRCLPLAIGNQYGFVVKSNASFSFKWDGRETSDAITFWFDKDTDTEIMDPLVESHFGHGIITIKTSFVLRTPIGVNLMTVNPPNTIIPNITVMTGVIETDNLRRSFTFNLKIQMPNIITKIEKGTPIAGFIPIPRYFVDNFILDSANNLFSSKVVEEEFEARNAAHQYRTYTNNLDQTYMFGMDIYGNKFNDHQRTIRKESDNE